MAAAFATLLLPYSLVGPFAGVLLDRWRRRQVLVYANLVRAGMVLGVAGLSAADVTGIPLYAAVLACLSVNRFFLAGLSAALPHVVTRDELVMANSVSTTSGTVVAIIGGGIGFALKRLFGDGSGADAEVIVVAALAYAVAGLLAARMDRDLLGPDLDGEPARTREARAQRRPRAGRRRAARVVAPPGRPRAGGDRRAPVLLRRLDHLGDPAVPELLPRPGRRRRRPRRAGGGVRGVRRRLLRRGGGHARGHAADPQAGVDHGLLRVAAAAEAVFVVTIVEWLLFVGAFVLGVAAQGSKICVDTIVQTSVDDAYRGRVFSFYDVLFNVAFVSAAAFGAAVLPSDGNSRGVYAVIAAGYAVTAVVYARATRRLDTRTATPPTLRESTT